MADPGIGVKAVVFVLKTLDVAAWFLTLGPLWTVLEKSKVKKIHAKAVSTADVNDGLPASKVFRAVEVAEGLRDSETYESLYAMAKASVEQYGSNPALGTRVLLNEKQEEGARFKTKVFGKTEWETFTSAGEKFEAFGSGLRELGMAPLVIGEAESFDGVEGDHTLLIYEETCAEWLLAAQGAFSQSLAVATTYATLGIESVVHVTNEIGLSTILCNYRAVPALLAEKHRMPTLRNIVYTTHYVLPGDRTKHPGQDSTVNVYSFEEIIEKGRAAAHSPTPPSPHNVALVMYTSGSTGNPKGVVIRHKQVLQCIMGIRRRSTMTGTSHMVGYLPLAHIFELMMELSAFAFGGTIGYSCPKSLAAGPGKCEPTGALTEFRPTFLGAVPKVWEGLKGAMEAKLANEPAKKVYVLNEAIKWKVKAQYGHRSTPVFDFLIFRKIRAVVGGRLEGAVSGGGALSTEVQEWARAVFGTILTQGYGLTETVGGLTLQHPADTRVGNIGAPLDTVEFLVHSEPDITDAESKPYLATDTEHLGEQGIQGRGEVWVRGGNITDGYLKNKPLTDEAYGGGWFKTGDIAVVLADGTIRIVDRKKNLVKLKGGEYIALERMNTVFNKTEYVDPEAGGCSSYGDHTMDRPIVFMQVNHAKVQALAKSLGVAATDPSEIVKDPAVQAALVDSLNKAGKTAEPPLSSLEVVMGVVPLTKPWSPLDGTLTATLKIAPRTISAMYADELAKVKAARGGRQGK